MSTILTPRLTSLVQQYESIRLKIKEKQGELEHIKRKIGRELELHPIYVVNAPKWIKVKSCVVKKHKRGSFKYIRV